MSTSSSLRTRFTDTMKEAMKAKEQTRLSTVRLMMARLKEVDIEARGKGQGEASEPEILSMLAKMVKQRQDSIALYTQAGREDLAQAEQAEISVIEEFLPKQLSADEVNAALKEAITAVEATSIKEMGKVVSYLKERYTGQMDFGTVSGLVKAALSAA